MSRDSAMRFCQLTLVLLYAVSMYQLAVELALHRRPRVLELFDTMPTAASLKTFERNLQTVSLSRQTIGAATRRALADWLGFAGSDLVLGVDGWLFHGPGVRYVTGPGILDASRQSAHIEDEPDFVPDPRPAIFRFNRDCKQAGAVLVLLPIPDKSMVQPRQLGVTSEISARPYWANNTGFDRLVAELRAGGVEVYFPSLSPAGDGKIYFLRQDSHWTPEAMDTAARDVAAMLVAKKFLEPGRPGAGFRMEPRTLTAAGDLPGLGSLTAGCKLYREQTIVVQRVLDRVTGKPWAPDEKADVLLLADSFTGVFSDQIYWGDAAGFAEHLSWHLGRGLATIVGNGFGAWKARAEVVKQPELLKGKRLVLWEFAVRELIAESWPVLPIPNRPPSGSGR